jgi:ArsR family transcriptional regulator, arsenate/arsenite/antimonite-responsive transcriptional repressor / arsenate reductase (thioredoxin)
MATSRTLGMPPPVLGLLAHQLRWQILAALARSDQRVSELVRTLGQPINLVSYHLKRLRRQHLVVEHRSSADSRAIYYSLDLDRLRALYMASGEALHPALGHAASQARAGKATRAARPVRILFLCTHNSARSQMAEGLMRHLGGKRVEVFSAGNEPSAVRPEAIQAMADLGIDISRQRSKHLNEYLGQSFDYIITVCDNARESCPLFPGDPERIHWSFPDPSGVRGAAARRRAFDQTTHQLQIRTQHLLTLIDREASR